MAKRAFYEDAKIKSEAVARAKGHIDAGRIKRGTFGVISITEPGTAEFRGCAVGCLSQPLEQSVYSDGFVDQPTLNEFLREIGDPDEDIIGTAEYAYDQLDEQFNFSTELCALTDAIFENLPVEEAPQWPYDLVKAIKVGKNVSSKKIKKIVDKHIDLQKVLAHRFDPALGSGLMMGNLVEYGQPGLYHGTPEAQPFAQRAAKILTEELS